MTLKMDFRQDLPRRAPTEEDVNLHIGKRIRRRRRLLGLTQSRLSKAVGLQFQQIQKYECAANKVCASRLYRLASVMQAPVQYFFDGLPQENDHNPPANDRDLLDSDELLSSKEARDLVDAYFCLSDSIRRKLREFAKALGEER